MDQWILQNVPPDERLATLRDNAVRVEPNYRYARELEEGEIQDRQNGLSQDMIAIDHQDQELKVAKEKYNAVVKPLKEQIKGVLQEIRTRTEEVNGDAFLMKDVEEGRMGYYSREGRLLYERRLLPEEMQFSIVDNYKKAQ